MTEEIKTSREVDEAEDNLSDCVEGAESSAQQTKSPHPGSSGKNVSVVRPALVLIALGLLVIGYLQKDRLANIFSAKDQSASGSSERKILYWQDPMHPAYTSDRPGKAPDCGMDLVPVYADQAETQVEMPPGTVMISSAKQQLIGVAYGEVAYEPVTHKIRTVGKVAFDETKIIRIHPKIEGWIEKVYVDFTGKLVREGQPLITIYSPELVSTQQEYLLALKAHHILGESEHEGVAASAHSLLESARKRLMLWDISEEQIGQVEKQGQPIKAMTLYAPNGGFILTRNAFERQRVTPETELYQIADLSTVWVLADIYEYEMGLVTLGQAASMRLSYYPGKTFRGQVTYIYPQLDSATRTLKVRLEFSNPEFILKPEMFANVELQIDYGRKMSVPEEAVLDSGEEQIVFVAREGGYFEPRKVQLGAKVDGRFIVLSGLKPGERIVISGNFLIDSESRLKSAAGAMTGHGGGTHSGSESPAAKPADRQKRTAPQPDHSQHERSEPKREPDHSAHRDHR